MPVAVSKRRFDVDEYHRMAEAGVPEYWIVDLNGRSVACYSEPAGGAYQNVHHHGVGDTVSPRSLPQCRIDTDTLLAE